MTNSMDIPFGVGVIVVTDGKILVGTRTDNGLICGPGGHIQNGEQLSESALRELQEEFSIKANKLYPLGAIQDPEGKWKPSMVFLCTDYEGNPKADEEEMTDARFADIAELSQMDNLFPCFAASLALLMNKLKMNFDGGPGSGNWGHQSVKGVRGGSAPGGGTANRIPTKEGGFTSEAKAWEENKKKSSGSSAGHAFKEALKSGDGEKLAKALDDAEPGQFVCYGAQGHKKTFMKLNEQNWLSFDSGTEYSSEKIGKVAKVKPDKFSESDLKSQTKSELKDCQEKFEKALDGTGDQKEDKYKNVLSVAEEMPVGAQYKTESGEIFVKSADGIWLYKEKSGATTDTFEALTSNETAKKISNSSPSAKPSIEVDQSVFDSGAYSKGKKDAATWTESKSELNERFSEASGKYWNQASEEEKDAIVSYTGSSYNSMNKYLFGIQDYASSETKSAIKGSTSFLNKCKTEEDSWVERGTSLKAIATSLGIEHDELSRRIKENDFADLIGKSYVQEGFISTSSKKGASFAVYSKVAQNIFLPKGSHAAYAEPFSFHGYNGFDGRSWDGNPKKAHAFGEFETIIQRGSTYKITKMYSEGDKLYMDLDVCTQEAEKLKKI